ncbi:MAG: hypothetical protein IT565_10270, partial [Rhodospirillales bacterium]|nr:hypothetical protein [Rhodospirillales bacterium]
VQDMHRRLSRPFLRLGPGTDPAFASDAADLGRLMIDRACADETEYRQAERFLSLTRSQDRVDLVPLASLSAKPPEDSLLAIRSADLVRLAPQSLSPTLFLPDLYFNRETGPAQARLAQLNFKQIDHGLWQREPNGG